MSTNPDEEPLQAAKKREALPLAAQDSELVDVPTTAILERPFQQDVAESDLEVVHSRSTLKLGQRNGGLRLARVR